MDVKLYILLTLLLDPFEFPKSLDIFLLLILRDHEIYKFPYGHNSCIHIDYRNNPKYLDRLTCTNSVDPDQMAEKCGI